MMTAARLFLWRCVRWLPLAIALFALVGARGQEPTRLIEITADRDSRYKISGQSQPTIMLTVGEHIVLRITARKAHGMNRDGSVHGFTLLRVGSGAKIDGWGLLLKPGTQDFSLVAPQEAGEYKVVCTVICSQDHEGMQMKVLVNN